MSLNYDLGEKLSKSYYFLGPKTPFTLGKFPWDLFFPRAYFLLGVVSKNRLICNILCISFAIIPITCSSSSRRKRYQLGSVSSFVSLTSFDPDLNHTATSTRNWSMQWSAIHTIPDLISWDCHHIIIMPSGIVVSSAADASNNQNSWKKKKKKLIKKVCVRYRDTF